MNPMVYHYMARKISIFDTYHISLSPIIPLFLLKADRKHAKPQMRHSALPLSGFC